MSPTIGYPTFLDLYSKHSDNEDSTVVLLNLYSVDGAVN